MGTRIAPRRPLLRIGRTISLDLYLPNILRRRCRALHLHRTTIPLHLEGSLHLSLLTCTARRVRLRVKGSTKRHPRPVSRMHRGMYRGINKPAPPPPSRPLSQTTTPHRPYQTTHAPRLLRPHLRTPIRLVRWVITPRMSYTSSLPSRSTNHNNRRTQPKGTRRCTHIRRAKRVRTAGKPPVSLRLYRRAGAHWRMRSDKERL